MKRKDLISILKLAEPALGPKEMAAPFQCFRFDGKSVVAYNDEVAISVPCPLKLKGGLNGSFLLKWMSFSKAVEVKIEKTGENARLKAGRSTVTTPFIDDEDFLFSFPTAKEVEAKLPIDKGLLESLARVSTCIGTDHQHPWRYGITVAFDDAIRLFTSDNFSAARDVLEDYKIPKELKGSGIILPPRFVELLLEYAKRKDEEAKELLIGESWVEARFKTGLRLWSRKGEDVNVEQFEDVFKNLVARRTGTVVITKGLLDCLNRLGVALAASEKQSATVTIKNERMVMVADGPIGQVKEVIRLSKHKNISVAISPELVKRALGIWKRMQFRSNCIYFKNGSCDHVIALASP